MTLLVLARMAVMAAIWRVPLLEPSEPHAWRLVETPDLHVGVRPAFDLGNGVGLTIQVSLRTKYW